MISFSDLSRVLNPIRRKIFLLIGKALLTAVNNTGEVGFYSSGGRANPQRVNVSWFGTLSDIEHVQPYGFDSYPIADTAKAVILSPDGSRSNAFVIMIQDDDYRPTDLSEGDVVFYGKNDAENQKHRLRFLANGNIELLVDSGKTVSIGNGTDELINELVKGFTKLKSLVGATLLAGTVDLGGIASTGTNSLILGGLGTMETTMNNIITALNNLKA